MVEEGLKVQLNKNFLELEYTRFCQYYITCIVILFTGIGTIIGIIGLIGLLEIMKNILWLNTIVFVSALMIYVPFVFAKDYRRKASQKRKEVIGLIKSVDKNFKTN